MVITKGTLTRLRRDLIKFNIKPQAISKAAYSKKVTEDYVRKVLNGDRKDTKNIIEHINKSLIKEKARQEKVLKIIDTNVNNSKIN